MIPPSLPPSPYHRWNGATPADERLAKALRLSLECCVRRRLVHEAIGLVRHGSGRVQIRQTNQLMAMTNALHEDDSKRDTGGSSHKSWDWCIQMRKMKVMQTLSNHIITTDSQRSWRHASWRLCTHSTSTSSFRIRYGDLYCSHPTCHAFRTNWPRGYVW